MHQQRARGSKSGSLHEDARPRSGGGGGGLPLDTGDDHQRQYHHRHGYVDEENEEDEDTSQYADTIIQELVRAASSTTTSTHRGGGHARSSSNSSSGGGAVNSDDGLVADLCVSAGKKRRSGEGGGGNGGRKPDVELEKPADGLDGEGEARSSSPSPSPRGGGDASVAEGERREGSDGGSNGDVKAAATAHDDDDDQQQRREGGKEDAIVDGTVEEEDNSEGKKHLQRISSGQVVVDLLETEHKIRMMRQQEEENDKKSIEQGRRQREQEEASVQSEQAQKRKGVQSMTDSEVVEYEELLQEDVKWHTSRSGKNDRKNFRHLSAIPVISKSFDANSAPIADSTSQDSSVILPRSHSSTSLSMGQSDGEDRDVYFRQLFHLPDSEQVLEDFHCAYYKRNKYLSQGRMYVSQNHVAFYSNVFSKKLRIVIPFQDITAIHKKTTVLIVPNAIEIISRTSMLVEPTDQSRDSVIASTDGKDVHFFGSFMFRDQTFNILREIWKLHQYKLKKQRIREQMQQEKQKDEDEVDDDDTENDLYSGSEDEDEDIFSGNDNDAGDNGDSVDQLDTWFIKEDNVSEISEIPFVDPFFPIAKCKPQDVVPPEVINLPLRVLCNIWMADPSPMEREYHEKRGDTEFQISKWHRDETDIGSQREAKFISPVQQKIGPSHTRIVVNQRMILLKGRKKLVNEQSMRSLDVPFGDTFRILGSIELEEKDSTSTIVRIRVGVHFVKSSLLKWKIESTVFKEASESYQFYFNLAREKAMNHIQQLEQRATNKSRPQHGGDQLQLQPKKKRKTKRKKRKQSKDGHDDGSKSQVIAAVAPAAMPTQPSFSAAEVSSGGGGGWMGMLSGAMELVQPYMHLLLFGFLAILTLFVLIPQQWSMGSSIARLEDHVHHLESRMLRTDQELNLFLCNMTMKPGDSHGGISARKYAKKLKEMLKSSPEGSEEGNHERLVLQSVLLELRELKQEHAQLKRQKLPPTQILSRGGGGSNSNNLTGAQFTPSTSMYHLHILSFAVLLLIGGMLYRIMAGGT